MCRIKLYFGAVQLSNYPIIQRSGWRDYELTLQNKGGVGGRLGYFVWEKFVFKN